MAKRQQRVDVSGRAVDWSLYTGKEMQVVYRNGSVFHGVLVRISGPRISFRDMAGNKINLDSSNIQELLLDYTTAQ